MNFNQTLLPPARRTTTDGGEQRSEPPLLNGRKILPVQFDGFNSRFEQIKSVKLRELRFLFRFIPPPQATDGSREGRAKREDEIDDFFALFVSWR
jgi:hypothetical protein